ncbi:MAG TPA: hypothetical protein VKB93_01215 [Thermoanaerobaculia bacterium]|nr:hypothetical protein [Thermoanaerobaculia bacterium]
MRPRTLIIAMFVTLTAITALAADTEPPIISRPTASPNTLSPADGNFVKVAISINVADNDDPKPRCAVRSVWSDDDISNDWQIIGDMEVALRASAKPAEDRYYYVVVICTDASGNEAGDAAPVRVVAPPSKEDRPPVLQSLTASPNVLSPPNGQMVPVKVDVKVTDDNDSQPRCAIRSVWSNQEISSDDWKISDTFEVALRATARPGEDRTYNVVVVCADSKGNEAGDSVRVTVTAPPEKVDHPPTLVRLSASPDVIPRANNEMVPVKIEVQAIDDNDPKPRCTVRSVWADQLITEADWRITGELEVSLRATALPGEDRFYHVVTVCTDSAGNEAGDAATVRVVAPELKTDNPPVLLRLEADPKVLSANNEMVAVKVAVQAIDDHDPNPRCAIQSVWSDPQIPADDWKITGALEVDLRASTSDGQDRIYNIIVICTDSAGNQAGDAAKVRVVADEKRSASAPVIMSFAATPDVLTHNDELTPVKFKLQVTDDDDPQPRCLVTNVWSEQFIENDWKISDDLEVTLRATAAGGQDRVYNVGVSCTDFAGNVASEVTTVRVPAAQAQPPSRRRSSRS